MKRFATPLALLLALTCSTAFAQQFGSIEGRITFDGDIPELDPLVVKGGKTPAGMPVKDPAVCGAQNVPDESLVVDPESKGIKNVFIYMKKAPDTIHPNLQAVPDTPVKFDQKGCQFEPHALIVRAGQPVDVYSQDNCAHNTHTFPIFGANNAVNFLMPPKPPKPFTIPGDKTAVPEILPIQVKCDIHSWMTAYWLILDHPYAAVTDAEGKFKIENLPEGEHEFVIWHERAGYLEKDFEVEVKANKVETIDEDDLEFKERDFD